MNKYLVLDIDNTLLDYNSGFQQYMEQQGHSRTESDTYDLLSHYPSVNCSDKMFNYVCQFNSHPSFSMLYPNPYMVEWVRQLRREGWKIVALSCFLPPYDSESEGISSIKSALYRHQNLERLFGQGFFDKVVFKNLGESKYPTFSNLAMAAKKMIIIDDAAKYLGEANEAKRFFRQHLDIQVYKYEQTYNQSADADVIVNQKYFQEQE